MHVLHELGFRRLGRQIEDGGERIDLRHDLDGLGETRPEDDLVAVVSA